MENRISHIPRPIVDESALPNVNSVPQPNVVYANAPNIIETLQILDVPDNQTAPATIQTASTPITASNPVNGALATLATLGIITAGAGAISMTATALAKKREQDEAKSAQTATLQKQQSAQAQNAGANWAENQAMQANAKQSVVTQVTQSQANKDFWASFSEWQQRELERIRNLLYILQNTRVTFTLIDANGVPNYSLGTIANYNGRQVLVTHDHFNKSNPNQRNSLAFIQQNFPFVHIQGSLNGTFIKTSDLQVEYRNPGVIFLSLANGNDFGVTPIAAEIAFNYRPPSDEICFYSYLPGFNSNDNVNTSITYPTLQLNQSITQYTVADYNAFLLHSGTMIPLPAGFNNPNGFIITYAEAGQGDSGTGLFNSSGQLMGVFQTSQAQNGTLGDRLRNFFYNWLGNEHQQSTDPAVSDNMFNIIQ